MRRSAPFGSCLIAKSPLVPALLALWCGMCYTPLMRVNKWDVSFSFQCTTTSLLLSEPPCGSVISSPSSSACCALLQPSALPAPSLCRAPIIEPQPALLPLPLEAAPSALLVSRRLA